MVRRSKKKYRTLADAAGLYGCGVLGGQFDPLGSSGDYELFVGLVLNSEREEIRQANVVREGIGAAFADRLSLAWLRALTDAEDTAMAAFNVQQRRRAEISDEDMKRFAEDAEVEAELAEIERMEREAAEAETQTTPG